MYSERYIGDRIRQRRNEIGLTQKELAAKINPVTSIETAPHTQVAQWESGKKKPGTDALIRLCNVKGNFFFVATFDDVGHHLEAIQWAKCRFRHGTSC